MTPKKIIFISKGEESASTRYRALNYFPYLKEAGWAPEHIEAEQNLFKRITLLKKARQADVVVILRKTFSGLYLRLLRSAAKYMIFDYDDAIFVRSNGKSSRTRLNRFRRMARMCDQVWAGNSHLAQQAKRYNSRVTMLPTSIIPEKYSRESDKPGETVDLVWIGSRSTKKYLLNILPALANIEDKVIKFRLKIIANFTVQASNFDVVPIAWSEEKEVSELASSHIGIAPMPDDPWTRGKCGLKVLQYMAAGLPTVASSTGVHMDLIEPGVTGFLADSTERWQEALVRLANDTKLRKKMGQRGNKRVIEHFSTTATFARMKATLPEALP